VQWHGVSLSQSEPHKTIEQSRFGLIVFPSNFEISGQASRRKVILVQTMIIRRRVTLGDAEKMPLHVADRSKFHSTTDFLIAMQARLRGMPYLCRAGFPLHC